MKALLLTTALILPAAAQLPGQPWSPHWFVDELIAWDPASDPDAPYNRSWVPLADRFEGEPVNPHARPGEADITALCAWYGTSTNPSQGRNEFDMFAFNYWMYLDIMVFWGGSAGEGIILAPSPYVIDAAHRNGVPVYGTIFFPPAVYGGQIQWVWDLVQKEGDTFPVADKLIEAAEYYGFDGWFINQETAGGNAQMAVLVRDFMAYVQSTSDIDIMWYDAMIENGAISWQNALNASNDMFFQDGEVISDEFFINFWWNQTGLTNSGILAEALGRSRYELFAGVDVEANGYGTAVNWQAVFPEGQPHRTSLGFYRPEWCYNSSSGPEDFYTKENRFWVGANRDPSNTSTSEAWKGMAHYVPDHSAVNDLPFVTNFDTGQGNLYAVDGEVLRTGEWQNLSLQDLLPTWRWIAQSTAVPLYPDLAWDDAYYGGTCLEVSGDIVPGAPTTLHLYRTDLPLTSSSLLAAAFRTGTAGEPSHMQIALDFTDSPGFTEFVEAGSTVSEGWTLGTWSLSQFSGRTLEALGLRFSSTTPVPGYDIRVGRLGILDGPPDPPQPPSGLWVEGFYQTDDNHGTIRLRWTHSPDPVRRYNVYRLNPDDSRTFLGATPSNAYFVPEIVRVGSEDTTTVMVEAVGPDFSASGCASTVVTWTTTGVGGGPEAGGSPSLLPPSCNPLRGPAILGYTLPVDARARISVYSVAGRVVDTPLDSEAQAGSHSLAWDASRLEPGVYFIVLDACGESLVERCVVLSR